MHNVYAWFSALHCIYKELTLLTYKQAKLNAMQYTHVQIGCGNSYLTKELNLYNKV